MSTLDRDGLVHETIEHLIDQVTQACKERDVLQAESDRMRDGISDMKSALQSEIDAERLRGDTYRRRALALRKQIVFYRALLHVAVDS